MSSFPLVPLINSQGFEMHVVSSISIPLTTEKSVAATWENTSPRHMHTHIYIYIPLLPSILRLGRIQLSLSILFHFLFPARCLCLGTLNLAGCACFVNFPPISVTCDTTDVHCCLMMKCAMLTEVRSNQQIIDDTEAGDPIEISKL